MMKELAAGVTPEIVAAYRRLARESNKKTARSDVTSRAASFAKI